MNQEARSKKHEMKNLWARISLLADACFVNYKYFRGKPYSNKERPAYSKGFTLLETLIAVSLISVALVGVVTVIISIIPHTISSRNRLAALHLAQEGVELVRTIRENNILCDILDAPAQESYRWDTNPNSPPPRIGQGSGTTFSIEAGNMTPITCGADTIQTPRVTNTPNNFLLFDSSTGRYGYLTGAPTIFKRSLFVAVGSAIPPAQADPNPAIPRSHQMDITSTVTWSEFGIAKNVALYERLYFWR